MVTMTHKNKDIGPKIALYEPDIPQNTASIIRTCSCLGVDLEIIEPCGFLFTDKRFKRVVMDYMEFDRIRFYKSADEFFNFKKNKRIILISTKGIKSYTNFNFNTNDTILFGRESAGVPKKIHNKVNEILKIPMINNKRSLNLSSSVAIVLAEQLRQIRNY
jgi:tRNA (cytidine/uridine-2'-O-)-methyltransferase